MLNHIVIMGRLTRDPELRRVPSGSAVCSFTVAVDRDFQSRDSAEKQTDFIDCVAWEQRAEFVSKWFTKGRMIIVEGRLESRKWQDKAGQNRVSWQIRADRVHFGETKRDAYGDGGGYGGAPGYGSNSGYGGGYNSGSGYGGYGGAPGSGYGNSGSGYGSSAPGYGSASASGYSGSGSASGYGSSAPGYGNSSGDAPGYGNSSGDAPAYGGKSDYNSASAPASGYGSDGHDNAYTPPAETPTSDFAEIGDEDGDLPF